MTHKIRILSLNVASLPKIFGMNFNNPRLSSSETRAQCIVEEILKRDDDIVCMQEAWDPKVADYYIRVLQKKFPCVVRGIGKDIQSPVKLVRGGMLIFSRFPIVEICSEPYPNPMIGEEWYGEKGFTAIKVLLSADAFATIYHSHLHAGGALCLKASKIYGGSTPERRAEQMKQLGTHIEKHAKTPPLNSKLVHQVTLVCADFNTCINDEARMLSVRTIAREGKVFHEIKRIEQYRFFKLLVPTQPKNFVEIRRNQKIDETLKAEAIKEQKATCSLKETAAGLQSGGKLIDGIFVCKDDNAFGEFATEVIQFNSKEELSDHLFISAVYDASKPKLNVQSGFEDEPVELRVEPPKKSFCSRFFSRADEVHYLLKPKAMDSNSDSKIVPKVH